MFAQYNFNLDTELKSVNSRFFKEKKTKLMKILNNPETSYTDKYKIIIFFCKKMYGIFRMDEKNTEKISNSIYDIVRNGQELQNHERFSYLHFRNEKMVHKISLKLLRNNIKNILIPKLYYWILEYMFKSKHSSSEIKDNMAEKLEQLYFNRRTDKFLKMHIADTFILCGWTDKGNILLDLIRQTERLENIRNERKQKKYNTVYDDSQNVHDSKINKSVLYAAFNLIKIHGKTDFDSTKIMPELVKLSSSPHDSKCLEKVLIRIETDTSTFRHEKDTFNLYLVFANIWDFILKNKHTDELKNRLFEEMVEMSSYCSTGHLARFMNVIQGFTDDPNLCIKISDYAQIKSVFYNLLTKIMEKAADDVMESMLENDNTLYINFIIENINKKLPKLILEYKNVENILKVIIDFTQVSNFIINDGKLSLTNLKND